EVANVRVGEVGCQKAQARQQRRPAPRSRLELQDLDLQRVSRFSSPHIDRAAEWVEAVEVEGAELGRRVALLELSGGDLFSVEVDDVAGVDLDHRRQRVVPLVVELVASDLVFTHSGSDAHLRTSSVTSAVMGTALARST